MGGVGRAALGRYVGGEGHRQAAGAEVNHACCAVDSARGCRRECTGPFASSPHLIPFVTSRVLHLVPLPLQARAQTALEGLDARAAQMRATLRTQEDVIRNLEVGGKRGKWWRGEVG